MIFIQSFLWNTICLGISPSWFCYFASCLPCPICQNTKWTSYFWNSGEIDNSQKKRSKNQIIFKVLIIFTFWQIFTRKKNWLSHIGIFIVQNNPLNFIGLVILCLPWFCKDLHGSCFDVLRKTKRLICFAISNKKLNLSS